MKTNKKFLIIGAILIIIIIIAAFVFTKNSASIINNDNPQIGTSINGPIPQSYAASKVPEVREGDKIFGSYDAPLKIFVYEDYLNAYSAVLADTLDKIKAETGDKIAIITRPYIINNSSSASLAVAAINCAGEQGKWKEMRALLFIRAKSQPVGTADFNSYAQQLSLNENNFQICLTNEKKSGKIEQAMAEAKDYAVSGAPTIFIGSEMILGARPYADFVDSNGDKIEGLKTVIDKKINIL